MWSWCAWVCSRWQLGKTNTIQSVYLYIYLFVFLTINANSEYYIIICLVSTPPPAPGLIIVQCFFAVHIKCSSYILAFWWLMHVLNYTIVHSIQTTPRTLTHIPCSLDFFSGGGTGSSDSANPATGRSNQVKCMHLHGWRIWKAGDSGNYRESFQPGGVKFWVVGTVTNRHYQNNLVCWLLWAQNVAIQHNFPERLH